MVVAWQQTVRQQKRARTYWATWNAILHRDGFIRVLRIGPRDRITGWKLTPAANGTSERLRRSKVHFTFANLTSACMYVCVARQKCLLKYHAEQASRPCRTPSGPAPRDIDHTRCDGNHGRHTAPCWRRDVRGGNATAGHGKTQRKNTAHDEPCAAE